MKEVAPADSTPVLDELASSTSQSPRSRLELDVLAWWKAKETKWPALAKMVKQYFAAPASSAGVERVFSAAGKMHGVWRPPEVGQGHHARALTLRGVQHRVGSRLVRGLSGSAGERHRGSAPRPSGPRALPRPRCVAAAVRRAALSERVGVCLGVSGRSYLLGIWV